MTQSIDIAEEMRRRGLTADLIGSISSLSEELSRHKVSNVDRWLSEIQRLLPDYGGLWDLCVEGWFASIFSLNGFAVEMKPDGRKGPDLRLGDEGKHIYVEVRHLRPDPAPTDDQSQAGCAVPYGDLEGDTKKLLDEIVGKSKQGKGVPAGAAYLVAIRSDKESIEEVEFERACEYLEEEARCGGAAYQNISGVLFYDGWANVGTGRRWYLWTNGNANVRLSAGVGGRLSTLQVPLMSLQARLLEIDGNAVPRFQEKVQPIHVCGRRFIKEQLENLRFPGGNAD